MPRIHNHQYHFSTAILVSLLLIFIFILTACQESSTTPTRSVTASDVQIIIATPTKEPFPFKTSKPGTTSVHGMLLVLDPMSLVPAPDDAIHLVPIAETGNSSIPQFEVGTVPQAEVDERNGEFMFTNITAGQYAVVVITRGGAQIPARYFETGNFAIFNVNDTNVDMVIELGKLSLP